MIFTQLTKVSAGTIYTSAGPAVASLALAKHHRDKHILVIFSLFFWESGEYYLKMKKSSSVIDLKHMIYLFPAFERKHCKYKCTIQNI